MGKLRNLLLYFVFSVLIRFSLFTWSAFKKFMFFKGYPAAQMQTQYMQQGYYPYAYTSAQQAGGKFQKILFKTYFSNFSITLGNITRDDIFKSCIFKCTVRRKHQNCFPSVKPHKFFECLGVLMFPANTERTIS